MSAITSQLAKHRWHIVTYSSNGRDDKQVKQDIDITYIDYRAPAPRRSTELNELLLSTLTGSLDGTPDSAHDFGPNLGDNASNSNSKFIALTGVAELRDLRNAYSFLAHLAKASKAQYVLEFGTASGTSLAAFLTAPSVRYVETVDIEPLNRSWLSSGSGDIVHDFLSSQSHRWRQILFDASKSQSLRPLDLKYEKPNIVHVDIDHNGHDEELLSRVFERELPSGTVVVWDDIRTSAMVSFWDGLRWPKIDVSGFGHISGTGLSLVP